MSTDRDRIRHRETAARGIGETWFAAFDGKNWDQQFEKDAASGKLDKLAADALDDLRNGKYGRLIG